MISEKINFLMDITQTNNSTLARALNFDPSYISRIRSGKRGVPKNQPFLEPLAFFIAKNIVTEFQKRSIERIIIPGRVWPDDKKEAEKLLYNWLTVNMKVPSVKTVSVTRELSKPNSILSEESRRADTSFYYGRQGKRDAVETFLTEAIMTGESQTLLLYSDEDFSWLFEDLSFARRWLGLLVKLIENGGRIIIIHDISRNMGEMLEGIKKWMPVYATGAVVPYYYPRIRDGVYHRTLFIAKGLSAISSFSVAGHDEGKLNLFLRDQFAVKSLEEEFSDYLTLCKPLMRIYTSRNAQAYFSVEKELANSAEDMICAGNLLGDRNEIERILSQGGNVTEILNLPDEQSVKDNKMVWPLADFHKMEDTSCTAGEYLKRLEHMIYLSEMYDNYQVVLTNQLPGNYMIKIKENAGMTFYKSMIPSTVFYIKEKNVIQSFIEDMTRQIKVQTDTNVVQKLKAYMNLLQI